MAAGSATSVPPSSPPRYQDYSRSLNSINTMPLAGKVAGYVKSDLPEIAKVFAADTLTPTIVGGLWGAFAAGVLAAPGGNVSAGTAAGFGAGIGAFFAMIWSTRDIYVGYKNWCKRFTTEELRSTVKNAFEQDPVLENYICPISCEIPEDPVRHKKTGKIYSRHHLDLWFRRKNTDPATNLYMDMSMVEDAPLVKGAILQRLKQLTNLESQETTVPKFLIDGLVALKEDLEKDCCKIHQSEINKIKKAHSLGKITDDEYNQQFIEISSVFGQLDAVQNMCRNNIQALLDSNVIDQREFERRARYIDSLFSRSVLPRQQSQNSNPIQAAHITFNIPA